MQSVQGRVAYLEMRRFWPYIARKAPGENWAAFTALGVVRSYDWSMENETDNLGYVVKPDFRGQGRLLELVALATSSRAVGRYYYC